MRSQIPAEPKTYHNSYNAILHTKLTFSERTGKSGARWEVRKEASASRNSGMPHIAK